MLEKLRSICPDIQENVPLSTLTTFRVGGPAELLAMPETAEQAAALIDFAHREGLPLCFLGKGSDILAADEGVRGIVLHTAKMATLTANDNGLAAGCGAGLPAIAQAAARQGLSGLEWAAGIPGSVGGGVWMNAGAYGGQMSDVVTSVKIYDGKAMRDITEHGFGYRHSVYMENPNWLILEAGFTLTPDGPEKIQARMDEYANARREKQPIDMPSAGSFFKRPPGHFAGALVEQCGLKGYAVGGAMVSEKHAGFVVNTGGAACRDIVALAKHVYETVRRETGAELRPEVRLLGDITWNF